MGNVIINILSIVLIGIFQHVHIYKFSFLTEPLFAVNRKFTLNIDLP